MMSSSNGRPEPEVIVNFADGFSYNKNKMEEFFRTGFLDKPYTKQVTTGGLTLKKDDLELIMAEYEIPKSRAELALHDAGGDVQKALELLSKPLS